MIHLLDNLIAMDPVSLQCFIEVAETGSFTKAAQRVFRTQSAISQQISKLEQMAGSKLFLRGRRLTLTLEGEILLAYAKQILESSKEALQRVRDARVGGTVHFGLPEDFASTLLSKALAPFVDSHPELTLRVDCDLTLNLFQRFRDGEFDLVLVKMGKPEDFPEGVEVWSEELCWVAKKGFFNNRDCNASVPLVLSPDPCVYRRRAIKALEQAKMHWRHVFSCPSYAGAIAAVSAGLGVSVLPASMIPNTLEIAPKRILPPLKNTHVSLLKRKGASQAVHSFEQCVLEALGRNSVLIESGRLF